jgi:hypothetical protein
MKTTAPPTRIVLGIAILMMELGAPMMKASTITYTYTGNDFTFAISPYTTSNSVTGSFTTSVPLADDLSLATITPISYSFTDGVQTITNLTPQLLTTFTDISTDANGNITQWKIALDISDTEYIQTIFAPLAEQGTNDLGAINGVNDEAYNQNDPGSWTTSPEPSGGFLMSTALLALALLARKRKFQANRPCSQLLR